MLFKFKAFSQDGTIDFSFNIGQGPKFPSPNSPWSNAPSGVNSFKILNNGKILILGYFSSFNGAHKPTLAILNDDGSLENNFHADLDTFAFSGTRPKLGIQKDFGYIICPEGPFYVPRYEGYDMIRVNFDGTVDLDFNTKRGYGFIGQVRDMVVQPDDKILVAGYIQQIDRINTGKIIRLNADGSPDYAFINNTLSWSTTFHQHGGWTSIDKILVLPNKKIILGGHYIRNGFARYGLFRINEDGTFDFSFDSGVIYDSPYSGYISDIKVDSLGKIFCTGTFHHYSNSVSSKSNIYGMVRLHDNGSIDNSFNYLQYAVDTFKIESPDFVLLQPDGKILVVDHFTYIPMYEHWYGILRLNYDGTIDSSFNSNCVFNDNIIHVDFDQNGRILACGYFNRFDNYISNNLVRLQNDLTVPCDECLLVSSSNLEKNGQLLIYPNPAKNVVRIKGLDSKLEQELFLFDITGKKHVIDITKVSENQLEINLETL